MRRISTCSVSRWLCSKNLFSFCSDTLDEPPIIFTVTAPPVRFPLVPLPNMEFELPVAIVAEELLAVEEVADDMPMLLESEGLRKSPVLMLELLLLRPDDEAGESAVELEDM